MVISLFLIPSIFKVHKVRFVASTLLDAVRKADTAPASAARAHAYLCAWSSQRLIVVSLLGTYIGDFLSILSEIERNYLWVAELFFRTKLRLTLAHSGSMTTKTADHRETECQLWVTEANLWKAELCFIAERFFVFGSSELLGRSPPPYIPNLLLLSDCTYRFPSLLSSSLSTLKLMYF